MFHQSGKTAYIDTHWKKKKIYRFERPPNRDYISEKGGLDEDDDHLICKFKLKMANTLSVMTNVLRNVVSKQRIRYKENGFDLDLAYIRDNIIAMGYPADNLESIYRNRLEDVYKFLEEHHQDRYKIYNLCLERSYDKNKFHGRVAVYPFEDHNPPTIELIQKFCSDVDTWLGADEKNVAAVHCKAGKGRTGTMICCYLLYSRQHSTAEEALAYYDSKRTKDRKGVTIPSQRRYVQYFSKLLQSRQIYEKRTLQFYEIRFTEAHQLHSHGTVHCSISVLQDTSRAVKVETLQNLCIDFRKGFTLDLRNICLDVTGDIKIELNSKPSRKKIFHFWFNTYFIPDAADTEGEGEDAKYVYTLNKWEIDDAHKDKEHKCYPENFKVHLVFYQNAATNRNQQTTNAVTGNRTSSSSNYELSHMKMGGRHYMTHNSYPLTTAVASAISPMAVSTQLNNSGSNLSYSCDQRSSSSSASVSSLVGGSGGSDSTKICVNKCINENRLMMSKNGNADLKLHPFSLRPSNSHRNVGGGGGLISEDISADSLVVQSTLTDYNSFSTANNVMAKQKLLRQQQQQQQQPEQQQQQQYQPSENNVTVPPSKVSRGSRSMNTQSKNHIAQNITKHGSFEGYMSGKIGNNTASNTINSQLSTNNGVLHATDVGENEHDFDYDVERDEAIDDDDDHDAEEDWESGESSAISLPHLKAPINTNTNITTNTTITTTFHKTPLLSSPISLTPSMPARTTVNVATRNTITNKKFLPASNSNELTGLPSMNLAPFTNTSTSSSCSLSSKAEISGETDGNDRIRNIINDDTDDSGDDDDNNEKVHRFLGTKPNGSTIIMKRHSNPKNHQTTVAGADNISASSTHALVAVPPTPRNKFFSFTLSKTRSPVAVKAAPDTPTNVTVVESPPKLPFFRRKSFKSANSNSAAGDPNSGGNNDLTASSLGCSGLAATSKQKLKIKLKKNRFKLAQKFQKLQNYLRTDPDDFCENFAQQTKARRNSNCSQTSRNHKAIATSTTATAIALPPQAETTITRKLSTSPGCNLKKCVKPPNALKACITPTSLEQLATQSSSSVSRSATASNASLGSSADCDLGYDCDDYYSSICDNQLSFDNSPCKSPRSLADIALMSGSHYMGSVGSFNVANSLSSSLQQQRTLQCQHSSYQSQHNHLQNNQRLPFIVNSNKSGIVNPRLIKDQQKPRHETSNDVVVVAAKPAKTHAIGFNVALPLKEIESVDCIDAPSQNINESSPVKAVKAVNGFVIGSSTSTVTSTTTCNSNTNSNETDENSATAYLTPPTSESTEHEIFDSCSSNEATKSSCTAAPFIFPEIINELTNIEHTTPSSTNDSKSSSPARPLNLLILKNTSTVSSVDENYLVTNKTPSPDYASLESMENIGDSSTAGVSNGNNTAGTGTSSSGFSTSECCTNSSSSSNGTCNCNPLVLDLERYTARINTTTCMTMNTATSTIKEKREQVEEKPTSIAVNEATIVEKESAESIRN